jgi:hypothetical protein
MSAADLARRLEKLGYQELFLRPGREDLERIWSASREGRELRDIVTDQAASTVARFLAAEVLAARPGGRGIPAEILARVYVAALREDATRIANPWGLPGDVDELGRRVVELGPAARSLLVELLDDDRRLTYAGSREATVGNGYRWRVKDEAAVLLAAIDGRAFEADRSPAKRDRAIAGLARRPEEGR